MAAAAASAGQLVAGTTSGGDTSTEVTVCELTSQLVACKVCTAENDRLRAENEHLRTERDEFRRRFVEVSGAAQELVDRLARPDGGGDA